MLAPSLRHRQQNTDGVLPGDHPAISAAIENAGVGIAGHHGRRSHDIAPAVERVPFRNRELCEINGRSLQDVFFDRSATNPNRCDWVREPLFEDRHHIPIGCRFRNPDETAHSLARAGAVREETAAKTVLVIFDVLEQQRRSELTRYFSGDRADLFVPIDLSADPLQVLSFVEVVNPLAQIRKCHENFLFYGYSKSQQSSLYRGIMIARMLKWWSTAS